MYKEYDKTELFQVLTANAAVKLRHNTVATITAGPDGGSDVQVAYGKATAMYGPDEKKLFESAASKNERLVIGKDLQAKVGALAPDPAFESWNAAINKDFEALHEGKSVLPKPLVRNMTKATWYFAQTFGDRYGEWLYDDLYGYVWRPFYNDRYPGGTWRPYFAGQWVNMGAQMFWVPSEPWGWVPYHLGVWQWDAKRGWFWLPGSAFSPAWVDWAFFNGYYFAWRPWSLLDWSPFYGGGMWGMSPYWFGYGYGMGWFDYAAWFDYFYGRHGERLQRLPWRRRRGPEQPTDAVDRFQGPAQEAVVRISGLDDAQGIQRDPQGDRIRSEARRRPDPGNTPGRDPTRIHGPR